MVWYGTVLSWISHPTAVLHIKTLAKLFTHMLYGVTIDPAAGRIAVGLLVRLPDQYHLRMLYALPAREVLVSADQVGRINAC